MLSRKVLLFSSLTLVIFIASVTHAQEEGEPPEADEFAPLNREGTRRPRRTSSSTAHTRVTTASKPTKTTTNYYPHKPYDPKEDKYYRKPNNYDDDRYGGGRYGDDDDNDDRYGGRYGNGHRRIGYDGVDPREYGQDTADFGPVYSDNDSMYASMNIWIRSADDWEQTGRPSYRKKYRGKKYNKGKDYKNKNYKDNDYKDNDYKDNDYKGNDYKDNDYKDNYDNDDDGYKKNYRKKRSYSRVKFPVRHFKDIRKFPLRNFPPLISVFPWLPVFYDKITYQTFIFSPTGGIYILPPLINFYGKRFAVAQLIKWGYASLVSSGAPPPPNVNVAPLVQPAAAPVPAASPNVPPPSNNQPPPDNGPSYDTKKNRFVGGVQTDFPDFKPRYSQTVGEKDYGYGNNRPVNRNSYGSDPTYGGTGRQEVYPQGGPQSGGGSN
ncbi:unnamed protein product [Adineta ricciae]|uniref:Uncharacterized protein n=1 Tax=Adineta ricciae TaxID=249248 RepID=A0A814UHP2_ADIRI|nr:unnamed protein product [Adineta ricciae]CAF1404252.1 unnamed protein product [Adineta ricciae]